MIKRNYLSRFLLIYFFVCCSICTVAQTAEFSETFKKIANEKSTSEFLHLKKEQELSKENLLEQVSEIFGLNEMDELQIQKKQVDQLGWTHYRAQQKHKGVPIEFSQYMLHEKNGLIQKGNGKLVKNLEVETEAKLSEAVAIQIVLNEINATKYAWEDVEMEQMLKSVKADSLASYCPETELVLFSPNFQNEADNYRLAYKMDVFSVEPYERNYYYVDAITGEIIGKLSRIHEHAAVDGNTNGTDSLGTAFTNYYGLQYINTEWKDNLFYLRSPNKNIETYTCNNGTSFPYFNLTDTDNHWNATVQKTACEAHWGAEKVYDYFFNEHGRNSFDGLGAKIQSWVNYGSGIANAFWNGSFMYYGDGDNVNFGPLTCLDVVGHELTHAVTERTAGLIYYSESGALNESFSDIFGTVIEFESDPNNADWYFAEDAHFWGNGFRSLSNPNIGYQPDTYLGTHWYEGYGDYGGVHINSGVQNYWFYLLCQGGSGVNDNGDSYNVSSIGMDKAAKIAYRNLTVYLSPNADHFLARNGSIEAAEDLYGLNSFEAQQVKNAWNAVGVGDNLNPSAGTLEITSFNNGEILTPNNQYEITWNYTGNTGTHILIDYSIDGGTIWYGIVAGAWNDGAYTWTVPPYLTNIAKLRVRSKTNSSIFDENEGYFSIQAANGTNPNNCNAPTLDLGPDVYLSSGGSVTLSTNITDAVYTLWDYQGSIVGTSNSVTVSQTGVYTVVVADACGNSNIDEIEVLPVPQNGVNVWPGDLDFNGIVEARDYLVWGLHSGETGMPRDNMDITWYPHPVADWENSQANGMNVKHVDGDGNGIIDLGDIEAVNLNYEQMHSDSPLSNPPASSVFSPTQISLNPSYIPNFSGSNNQLIFDIDLLSLAGNALAVYGIAFKVFYNDDLGAASNPVLNLTNTWLGTVDQDLHYFAHHDPVAKSVDIAITKSNHANSIGSGKIGELVFDINASVFSSDANFDIIVDNILVINSQENNLSVGGETTTLTIGSNGCPYDLDINANTYLGQTQQAANDIKTNGVMDIMAENLTLKANKIILNEGFQLHDCAQLTAVIEPCASLKATNDDVTNETTMNIAESQNAFIIETNIKTTSEVICEIWTPDEGKKQTLNLGSTNPGTQAFNIDKKHIPIGQSMIAILQNGHRQYTILNH